MIGALLTLLYSTILFCNALVILNNQRFLKRIGLPMDPDARKYLSATKIKIVDLLRLVRSLMIFPLIVINSVIVVYELFLGN